MGPEVQELEEARENYVGTKHYVSCTSGTDALLMALMAYDVGPGDAIFTNPFTFIATTEVISFDLFILEDAAQSFGATYNSKTSLQFR